MGGIPFYLTIIRRKENVYCRLVICFLWVPASETSNIAWWLFYVTLCRAITARNKVILAQTFTTFENPIFQGEKRVLCRETLSITNNIIIYNINQTTVKKLYPPWLVWFLNLFEFWFEFAHDGAKVTSTLVLVLLKINWWVRLLWFICFRCTCQMTMLRFSARQSYYF